jgi:hypothetical protein
MTGSVSLFSQLAPEVNECVWRGGECQECLETLKGAAEITDGDSDIFAAAMGGLPVLMDLFGIK